MNTIDTSRWAEFRIDQWFTLVKGTRLTSLARSDGDIPYVGASQFNNGITHFIGNDEKLHPGGVLTVCYNGPVGTTFYQPQEFWATDDVNVLYPKVPMSMESMLFIAPMIENAGSEYAYIDKWKMTDMAAAIIRLPITPSGTPDWEFMEQTMRGVLKQQERELDTLALLSSPEGNALDTTQWKRIPMADIFEMSNTKSITAASLIPDSGEVPYVTAQEGANGVQMYVDCPDEWLDKGECILIGGKTLTFSYQKYDFCSNDSHNIALYSRESASKSENCQLFLISALRASLEQTYSWGDSISMKRIKDDSVMLPVTSEGNPDWAYMEQTMRHVLNERETAISSLQTILSEVV